MQRPCGALPSLALAAHVCRKHCAARAGPSLARTPPCTPDDTTPPLCHAPTPQWSRPRSALRLPPCPPPPTAWPFATTGRTRCAGWLVAVVVVVVVVVVLLLLLLLVLLLLLPLPPMQQQLLLLSVEINAKALAITLAATLCATAERRAPCPLSIHTG